jgi:hypothetical protein
MSKAKRFHKSSIFNLQSAIINSWQKAITHENCFKKDIDSEVNDIDPTVVKVPFPDDSPTCEPGTNPRPRDFCPAK